MQGMRENLLFLPLLLSRLKKPLVSYLFTQIGPIQ